MLVYVRKSDLPDVMRSLSTSADTPTTAGAAAAASSAAAAAATAAGADSAAVTDDSSIKAAATAAASAAAAIADDVDEDYTPVDLLGTGYESGEAVDPMELDDHDLGFRVLGDKADSSSDLSAAAAAVAADTTAAAADVAEIDLEGIPPELSKRFREEEEAILQAAQDERVSTAQPLLHLAV
jgi:hypothetical protein